MTRNDIMEDLQAYMDDLEDSLHRALEREQMWKDHCQELKKELHFFLARKNWQSSMERREEQ